MDDNKLEDQLVEVLRSAAADFVKGNSADVIVLGEDAVREILTQEASLMAYPTLEAGASLEQRAALEEILEKRSAALQLVAKAELEAVARLERLRANAVASVTRIVAVSGPILAGAVVKAYLSK